MMNELMKYGLAYYIVTTGRACLTTLENNDIYTVLIDNSILDIKGHILLELVSKLKQQINLIFVNSRHDPNIESLVRQAGIVYYSTDMRDKQIVCVIRKLTTNNM
ncbi:MAG: hypothetical protein ACE5IR_11395 [bacterium]